MSFTPLVGRVLVARGAERQGCRDGGERGFGDGDADHATPRLIGTTLLAASLVTQVATGKAADAQVGTGGMRWPTGPEGRLWGSEGATLAGHR